MYVLAVMGELIVLFRDSKRLLYKLLAVGSSVIAVILPLCVTTEKGPRLFFTSHVLLVLLAIMLLAFLIDRIPKRIYRCGVLCSITVAVILVAFYGKVYYEIGECKDQRNAIIAQAIESDTKVIVLPNYPHGDFLWLPNPTSESREGYFKEFYGIPQDFTLIFEE